MILTQKTLDSLAQSRCGNDDKMRAHFWRKLALMFIEKIWREVPEVGVHVVQRFIRTVKGEW